MKVRNIPFRFLGKKKNWKNQLETFFNEKGDYDLIIDVFGGSGWLSYFFKELQPSAEVVWNDFDRISDEITLEGLIEAEETRRQLTEFWDRQEIELLERGTAAFDEYAAIREQMQLIDWFSWESIFPKKMVSGETISGLSKIIRKVPKNPLDVFLPWENCTIEHLDAFALLEKYSQEIEEKRTLILFDPPYLSSYQEDYESFPANKIMELFTYMKENRNADYLNFSKTESGTNYILQLADMPFVEVGIKNMANNAGGNGKKKRVEDCYFIEYQTDNAWADLFL